MEHPLAGKTPQACTQNSVCGEMAYPQDTQKGHRWHESKPKGTAGPDCHYLSGTGYCDFTVTDGVLTACTGNDRHVIISANLGITEIEDGLFAGNPDIVCAECHTAWNVSALEPSKLQSVSLPETINTIGDSAFEETALVSVNIPASVTDIAGGAFSRCRRIISLTMPDNVRSIDDNDYTGCSSLKQITIVQTGAGCDNFFPGKLSGFDVVFK